MTEREALKLALEALWVCSEHNALHHGEKHNTVLLAKTSITTIKEALAQTKPCDINELCIGCSPRNADGSCPDAQPKQEPVATLDDLEQEIYENTRQFVSRDVMEWMLKRYYTTPPQRTWVGLTNVEKQQAVNAVTYSQLAMTHAEWVDEVQKETERKLKAKNT